MNRDMVSSGKYILKVYDNLSNKVSNKYELTNFELRVLLFFANNPDSDTARDLVEILGISKSNVSEAIDSLTKKGYLKGFQDDKDRRYIHLKLQDSAYEIIDESEKVGKDFIEKVTKDIPKEKVELCEEVLKQIVKNIIEESKSM